MHIYLVYNMDSSNEYTVYLSSQNSLSKFPHNNCSEFTNNLVPPLLLGDSSKWSVSLKSLLMPYLIDNDSHRNNPIKFTMTIEIFLMDDILLNNANSTIKRVRKTITILSHQLINLTTVEIFYKFFDPLLAEIQNEVSISNSQLKTFFNLDFDGVLTINQHIRKKKKTGNI